MQLSIPLVLFLIFVTLKLSGLIAWSWLWVTAPLWGGVLLVLAIWALFFLAVAIAWRSKA